MRVICAGNAIMGFFLPRFSMNKTPSCPKDPINGNLVLEMDGGGQFVEVCFGRKYYCFDHLMDM